MPAINVQKLTAQADATRRSIQEIREQARTFDGAQRTELKSDLDFRKAVTGELAEVFGLIELTGMTPQDALRQAGVQLTK